MKPALSEIRALLKRLDGSSADSIENETIECLSWDTHPEALDRQFRDLRQEVVAFANQRGGTVLLGIADRKRTRTDAIQGVGNLDPAMVRKKVYDGTEPHILVDVDELIEPEGRILAIHVPRGIPPHTTSEGIAKRRVGKQSMPLLGSDLARLLFAGGQRDLTAQTLPGSSLTDLDVGEINRLRRIVATEGSNAELAGLQPDADFLKALELITDGELTLAAVLLLGKPAAMAGWVPQHEATFLRFKSAADYDMRRDLRGPLLAVLEVLERFLKERTEIRLTQTQGFGELSLPDFTWQAAREAILNALVHRDYFLSQSVQVCLYKDRLEVVSPGGFIGGVGPRNLLRHPPVRRNPRLAEVLQKIGLVNRAGLGVDRIYEELLKYGKRKPSFYADESHVRVVLSAAANAAFAAFVAEERRAGKPLELDDLICLRALAMRAALDRRSASEELQLPEKESSDRLVSLRNRGYLTVSGRGRGAHYSLQRLLSDRLRGQEAADQDMPLDEEAVCLRLEAVLGERGRLTNAEVRRISGYSRTEAVRVMRGLVEEGGARLVGQGRGAHYVPGSKKRK